MKRILLLIFGMIFGLQSFSQGEFNNWYFGFNCGINFNTNPPTATTNGAVSISDQTSTISDSAGNLIMYSDGLHVYNRNHAQMPNGFDLMGSGTTYAHASIIARKPGSHHLYYIFTLTYFGYPAGFQYGIVDMNLQGGNGDVISKNNPLVTPVCEKLTAVRHTNGTDIWLITHEWNTNAFYSYLLTASGLTAPVITHIGPVQSGGSGYNYNAAGQLVASCDGTKIAMATYELGFIEIYDFNQTTGIISNQIQISGYNRSWGVQFSPDGSRLYITQWAYPQVTQFNLLAGSPANIANSATLIGNCTTPDAQYKGGFMQLAPDNKIYIAKMNSLYIATIDNPNALGTACNFVDNSLYLAGKTSQAGLPQYIFTPFSIPDFTYLNSCQGDSTDFQTQNLTGFSSYSWNFGDAASGVNNSSAQANPSHYYSMPGNYTVVLIANQGSISDTVTHTVTIYPAVVVDLGNDTTLCTGGNLVLNAGNAGGTYLWSTGATSQTITINNAGNYWVSVSNGNCENADTIQVSFQTLNVNLGNDTTFCGTSAQTLNAGNAGSSYLWSNGATTQTIQVATSGTYQVTVNNGVCTGVDNIAVTFASPPTIDLGDDTTLCSGNTFVLNAGNTGGTYLWSTGATTQTIPVNNTGTYWVSVNNGMCWDVDSVQINFQTLNVNLGNDTTICGATSQILNAGNAGNSYNWSTGESTQTISVSNDGTYWVTVSNSVCLAVDSINVVFSAPPIVNLGKDTVLCPGNTVQLNAWNAGAYYNWSTGQNSSVITIYQSGTYWVEAVIGSCFVYDTINIEVVPQLNLGGELSLCDNPEILLTVPGNYTEFTWSTGSTDTFISITEAGTYWLNVQAGQCLLVDTVSVVGEPATFFLPNSFTPNGDGLNDLYGPVCLGIPEYHLIIFSSWGELIFESNDVSHWWDGRYKGKIVKVGVYTWKLEYKTSCDLENRIKKFGIVVVVK